MGEDIDRVRERTGIDKLDTGQRKKLFRDFIEHGGKVVGEGRQKAVRETLKGHPDRAAAGRREKTSPEKFTQKRPTEPSEHRAPRRPATAHQKKVRKKNSLKIYLFGVFMRAFSVSGNRFTDRFLEGFRNPVKNHFINLHYLVNSFFKGKWSIRKEVITLSTGENSLFYEILHRMCVLYNENEFETISKSFSNKMIPSGSHVEVFKQFFKRIYILGQYTDLCKFFIQKAVDLQVQSKKLEKAMGSQMKSKLKSAVNAVLIDYLPKFHIILCRMAGSYLPLYSQHLDDYLGLTEQDRIGYITRVERKKRIDELKRMKEYLKRKQTETQEAERPEVKVPRHVERGLRLIDEALDRLEKTYLTDDEKNIYRLMEMDDKLYKTAQLLDCFEKEYSFILTTGKISFNIDYQDQKKIDIKQDLSHTYLLLSEARHEVKDYIDTMREIRKTESDVRLNIYQKSSMLDSLQKKRSVLSKDSRNKIAEVMDVIHDCLSTIINDYNNQRRLLQNPEDRLDFTEEFEGVKRMHGKMIIEAIVEAFLFSSAFHFLLFYGELSGSGLTIEGETQPSADPEPQ